MAIVQKALADRKVVLRATAAVKIAPAAVQTISTLRVGAGPVVVVPAVEAVVLVAEAVVAGALAAIGPAAIGAVAAETALLKGNQSRHPGE